MVDKYTWNVDAGASKETQLKTNVTQFGDGYEQVSVFGINNAREYWQCKSTGTKSLINQIEGFLLSKGGVEPFIMDFCGKQKTYRTEGAITCSQLSGNIWSVSFTVKEVFLP